jgi:hypothetical protein
MKYSNYIGVTIALLLISVCFTPWIYIESIDTIVTGVHSGKTNFGKPGYMNILMSGLAIIFFLVPATWAKRSNLFVCTFNFAWSVRNFLLITQCEMGECPEKKWGIYALVVLSLLLVVLAFVPKIKIEN